MAYRLSKRLATVNLPRFPPHYARATMNDYSVRSTKLFISS